VLVIELTYKKPMHVVEEYLKPHRDFLAKCYKEEKFLASGPQNPRVGGIILALVDKVEGEALIQQDPFFQHEIADYRVLEFDPVLHDEALAKLV
jgi:uncharacterized protein YciI